MFTPPDHDRGREASGPARARHWPRARALRTAVVGVLCALASTLSLLSVGAVAARADDPSETLLALGPGWVSGPFATGAPKVELVDGIVHFSGAIATSGNDALAFTLPVGFRPTFNLYLAVDMCDGTTGALNILPSGAVWVDGDWSQAQCFTSLDGVSFVQDQQQWFVNHAYTPVAWLSPVNGWSGKQAYGYAPAAVEEINGVVYFSGAIGTTGTNPVAFTLPPQFRPSYKVFVNVKLCGWDTGRLDIYPDGDVQVEAKAGDFGCAQVLTSLDGASFVLSAVSPPTELTLQPGWTGGPYGTANPQAVPDASSLVELQGAMATSGTNPVAFTLPPALRPQYTRYVPVDMCNGTSGRLDIYPDGNVQVEAQGGTWSNAACFTSLDGVSFIR